MCSVVVDGLQINNIKPNSLTHVFGMNSVHMCFCQKLPCLALLPMADLQLRSRLLCSCRVTHTTLAITYPFPPLMHMFFAPCNHLTKLQLVRHKLAIRTSIEQSRFVRSTSHGVVPAHDLRVNSVHAPSTARPAPPVDHAVSKERHAGRITM